jgi:hypothetical protein
MSFICRSPSDWKRSTELLHHAGEIARRPSGAPVELLREYLPDFFLRLSLAIERPEPLADGRRLVTELQELGLRERVGPFCPIFAIVLFTFWMT